MQETVTVSNSSPIIIFSRIDQLELVHGIFNKIIIPAAVREEVFGCQPIPPWITVQHVLEKNSRLTGIRLGLGETECIKLSIQISASRVLLDDLAARKIARTLGIKVMGSVGLLLLAKRNGLISEVRPILEAMIETDFRISERLFSSILQETGEEN